MESSRQSGQRVSERLTTAERRHNLPELLTALVGRERDVVEVAQRLGTTGERYSWDGEVTYGMMERSSLPDQIARD